MASNPAPNSRDVVTRFYDENKIQQKQRHKLTNIDSDNKFGTCSICGPVKILKRDAKTWRCSVPSNERSKLYKQAYRQSKKDMLLKACEICGTQENLCWDHDHKTNKFRGTLCGSCNVGLGHFKDSPELLEKARKYLNESRIY